MCQWEIRMQWFLISKQEYIPVGCVSIGGGVSALGPGGVCLWVGGVSASGSREVCLPPSPEDVPLGEEGVSITPPFTTPLCGQQTSVKTLPCPNFVCRQ